MHRYLGVPQNSPEVGEAHQTIPKACPAHNIACDITAITKNEIEKRLKEEWEVIRTGRGE